MIKVGKTELRWNKNYELAKKYYEYHGNLSIKNTFITINGYEYDSRGTPLGLWIYTQRKKYHNGTLDDVKIRLLESIGMVWSAKPDYEEEWDKKYALAQLYYSHHGNLDMKKDFKTKNGFDYDPLGVALGEWIVAQRMAYKKGTLPNDKIQKLELIKMIWDVPKERFIHTEITDTRWPKMQTKLLREFNKLLKELAHQSSLEFNQKEDIQYIREQYEKKLFQFTKYY